MKNNRKNLFHTARDLLRWSIYEKKKCMKNIDKYTKKVEEDLKEWIFIFINSYEQFKYKN
jgi:hypothetical protein